MAKGPPGFRSQRNLPPNKTQDWRPGNRRLNDPQVRKAENTLTLRDDPHDVFDALRSQMASRVVYRPETEFSMQPTPGFEINGIPVVFDDAVPAGAAYIGMDFGGLEARTMAMITNAAPTPPPPPPSRPFTLTGRPLSESPVPVPPGANGLVLSGAAHAEVEEHTRQALRRLYQHISRETIFTLLYGGRVPSLSVDRERAMVGAQTLRPGQGHIQMERNPVDATMRVGVELSIPDRALVNDPELATLMDRTFHTLDTPTKLRVLALVMERCEGKQIEPHSRKMLDDLKVPHPLAARERELDL